jgi:hypothetical protein
LEVAAPVNSGADGEVTVALEAGGVVGTVGAIVAVPAGAVVAEMRGPLMVRMAAQASRDVPFIGWLVCWVGGGDLGRWEEMRWRGRGVEGDTYIRAAIGTALGVIGAVVSIQAGDYGNAGVSLSVNIT